MGKIISLFFLSLIIVGCSPKPSYQAKSLTYEPATPLNVSRPVVRNETDDYHVIVFSYNAVGGRTRPSQAHTFATWVRSKDKKVLEQVDISWLPIDDNTRLNGDEILGKNLPLEETLRLVGSRKLSYWVLRTNKVFFEAAIVQKDSLKYYKVLDNKTRPMAVNCIHACSDVAGYLDTGTANGVTAGQKVADFFVEKRKAWPTNEKWIVDALRILDR